MIKRVMLPETERLLKEWRQLGRVELDELEDSRDQLHWASQIPASVGFTLLEPRHDWSHISLTSRFVDGEVVLVSGLARDTIRCGLRLHDATLMTFDQKDNTIDTLSLDGKTLDEGYAWLEASIRSSMGDASIALNRPDQEPQAHAVGQGGVFSLEKAADFREIAGWYANAEQALRTMTPLYPEASPIRCWPHHFDLASLLTIDVDEDPEEARSIGIGFVPGDKGYDEPYFYITPWPYPDSSSLPFLEGGHWHVEGWLGAVLVGSELLEAGGPSEEVMYLVEFIKSGVDASRGLLTR